MRTVVCGAAVALTLGVMSGRLLHPDLGTTNDRPMGPQMFADWVGEGSTGPFDGGTTFAAYHGQPPDYVYGSDWKRATTWPSETAAATRVSYDEPADPPHADDPGLNRDSDDTTVAERDPNDPSREPAYDAPADAPDDPSGA